MDTLNSLDIEEGGHPKRRFHKKWCLIATASVGSVVAIILLAGLVRFLVGVFELGVEFCLSYASL